jgi:hypothetical protein
MRADLIDSADVGVIEPTPHEPRDEGAPAPAAPASDHPEGTSGNKTAKVGVLGLVDHTHPPAAQLLENAIVQDRRGNHARRLCGMPDGTGPSPMSQFSPPGLRLFQRRVGISGT